MKILTKYIIKKFLSYFLSSFTVVSIFVFIINLFETANQLAKKNIDFSTSLKTAILQTPYFIYLVLPFITLIATIMFFSSISANNEDRAVYASGYRRTVFLSPLIISSLMIILLSIFFIDPFVATLYKRAENRKNEILSSYIKVNGVYFMASDVKNKYQMSDVYIEDESKKFIIKASSMTWNDDKNIWDVKHGVIIKDKNLEYDIKISTFESLEVSSLPGTDDIFIEKLNDANSYSIYDLLIRALKLRRLSLNPVYEFNYIYFKLAMIFLNITVVLAAFIIAQTSMIRNKSISISLALIASLLMWSVLIVSKRLGDLELVSSPMILIIPHTIFISLCAGIMYKKRMI
ncbi:MAG: YjgP/YjgQ family permease [Elusimicrobia bacterium]|nr:YjgP/YjgQ family permease [Elusimicrobiota bacterium]